MAVADDDGSLHENVFFGALEEHTCERRCERKHEDEEGGKRGIGCEIKDD